MAIMYYYRWKVYLIKKLDFYFKVLVKNIAPFPSKITKMFIYNILVPKCCPQILFPSPEESPLA